MTNQDIFAVSWQGGGGLGDPLDRVLEDVTADIERGLVTPGAARDVYGVVIGDPAATRKLRRELRSQRIGREVPETTVHPEGAAPNLAPGESWLPLGDRICAILSADCEWRAETLDGVVLSRGSTRWREGAIRFAIQLPEQVVGSLHADLGVVGWACPVTGHLLGVDIDWKDAQQIDDFEIDSTSAHNHALAQVA